MTKDNGTTHQMYLGDAVYASYDGYQIWLRTGDGNDQRIALEPAVLEKLFEFAHELGQRRVRAAMKRELSTPKNG